MAPERDTAASGGVTLAEAEAIAAANEQSSGVGKPDAPKQLLLGLVFGLAFGFLLQKMAAWPSSRF